MVKKVTWGEANSRILIFGYDIIKNRNSTIEADFPFKDEHAEENFGILYEKLPENAFILTFPITDFELPILSEDEAIEAHNAVIAQVRDQEPTFILGFGEFGKSVLEISEYGKMERRQATFMLVIEHPEYVQDIPAWEIQIDAFAKRITPIEIEKEVPPAIEIEKGDKIEVIDKVSEFQHAPFVHLHCHDEYSLLDGFANVEDYAKKAHERGWKHLAITNHGLVGQIPRQYMICKELGLNAIFGCEIYINDDRDLQKKKSEILAEGNQFVEVDDIADDVGQQDLFGNNEEKQVKKKKVRKKELNLLNPNAEIQPELQTHNHHLVLLAKNDIGFKNLLSIVSDAWLNGFYRRPRVTHKVIEQYKEGLICGSACLGGMVSQAILNGNINEAKKAASYYKSVFGEDFYLELMLLDIKEQYGVNKILVEIGQELDIPLVITNDCHYVHKDDSYYQDILLLIQNNKTITDLDNDKERNKIFQFHSKELWFKTAEELDLTWKKLYAEIIPQDVYEQAKLNTVKFAEKCKVTIDTSLKLPKFDTPAEYKDSYQYLEETAWNGLRKRLTDDNGDMLPEIADPIVYKDRLTHELDVVKRKGFTDYFLVVYDMVRFARTNNITVGPGRGSAAGSLMCWAIGITDVDPVKFGLFFERFLNEAREDLPDIDMDFEPEGREHIKNYLIEKYGREHTCSIGTYGSYMTKAAILDVCRVFDVPLADSRSITKTLDKEVDEASREEIEANPDMMKIFTPFKTGNYSKILHHGDESKTLHPYEVAWKLRNKIKNLSAHAAGFIISNVDLTKNLPLAKREGNVLSQWIEGKRGGELSRFGYVKWDILGLMNLTFIREACELIEQRTGRKIDVRKDMNDLNDPNIYKEIRKGKANLIFQFESPLFHKLLKDADCDNFETLAAITALGRPGPLQSKMTEQFCLRRRGLEKFTLHPVVKEALDYTFGIICVAKGTLITLENNKTKPIESLINDPILGFDLENNKIINNPYQQVIKTKENAKCLIIKTLTSEITITPEHEIFTLNGWKQAKDLIIGENIATPRPKEYYGDLNLVKEAKFIGYLLANGNIRSGNWNFVSKNKTTLCNFENTLIELFGDTINIKKTQQVRDVLRIWSSGAVVRKNPTTQLLKNYGLLHEGEYGCVGATHSKNKFIPNVFKNTTKETKIALLKAIYECDGSKEYALYSTISKQLAYDVKEYYDDIGILSFVKEEKQKNFYRVFILDIKRFNEIFDYNLKASYGEQITGHRRFLEKYCKDNNISFCELGRQKNEVFINNRMRAKRVKRCSLNKYEDIITFLKYNIRWDEIKTISETFSDVYDITNTLTGNFIANNILVHNCYQEQIMQIANKLGGLPLKDTDTLRKVLSKAKGRKMPDIAEKLTKYRKIFVENGKKHMTEKELNILFDNFENFASYGFNRSHAVCYTIISFRCAWLKTYYPKEYICSVLRNVSKGESGSGKKTNKYETYIKEAIKLGIKILKPEINHSRENFVIEGDKIRIGLSNMKGVGEDDAKKIIEGYPYVSFDDFFQKNKGKINKSKMLAVIFNGLLDEFIGRVEAMIIFYKHYCGGGKNSKPEFLEEEYKRMMKDEDFVSVKMAKALSKLSNSFTLGTQEINIDWAKKYEFDDDDKEKIFAEEFGLTLSNALNEEYPNYPPIGDLLENGGGATIGIVKSFEKKTGKKEGGKEYFVAKMTDNLDEIPIYIWGNEYEQYRGKITKGDILYFSVSKNSKFDSFNLKGLINMLPVKEAEEELKRIVDKRNACLARIKNKEGFLNNIFESHAIEENNEFVIFGFVSNINMAKICRFTVSDESSALSVFLWAKEGPEFIEKVNNGDFVRIKVFRREDFNGMKSYNVQEWHVYK